MDLEVRGGEILALLGENGAGKSTLMNVLVGLVRPDAGRLILGAPERGGPGPGGPGDETREVALASWSTREAREAGGEILVMTAKVERNLPTGWAVEGIAPRVLDVEAVPIENEGDYLSMVFPQSRKK